MMGISRNRELRAAVLSALLLSATWSVLLRAQSPEDVEAKVKAAFVLNFARYVEWPESSFANSNTPVVIGVLGQEALQRNLEETVQGKTVERRPVQVKRARNVSELLDCHVIFIPASERG